jgi:LppX_LprAFG lipoprotein
VTRTIALLVTFSLAALGLAGCGSEDVAEAVSPRAAVAEAATKTADAGSARVSFTGTVSGVPGGPFTVSGEGEYSEAQARMTFDMSDLGAASGAAFGGEMEMVMDGSLMYMKLPSQVASGLPGGKEWIRLDLAAAGEELGLDFEELMQVQRTDPTQTLKYLLGASEDFERVGSEEVRGVETTHYRGTVDLRKALEQIPADSRDELERVLELVGDPKMPFEVWIDDDGLARQMKYEQPMPVGQGGEDATMALTMEMYDFGADVDVEPPPDDEVIDLQELGLGG